MIKTNLGFVLCLLATAVVGLSQLAARADGQECWPTVELRKQEILKKLGGGVRLHRREDLEDDLLQVSPRNPKNLISPVLLYEIQDTRFMIVKDEVLTQVCNDGCSRQQYVGISSDGNRAYRLFGFEHPERAFEAMVADAKVRIGNVSSADTFGSVCAELVGGGEAGSLGSGQDISPKYGSRFLLIQRCSRRIEKSDPLVESVPKEYRSRPADASCWIAREWISTNDSYISTAC